MPPVVKITRDSIVSAAVQLVRQQGTGALNARSLAAFLGCSTQPLFSNFENMEQLRQAVLVRANELYQNRIAAAMTQGEYPPYKASGMAYIAFAAQERELFKLLFMRDRTGEIILENRADIQPLLDILTGKLGLCEDDAYRLHLELWVAVHGMAAMIATGYLQWDTDFISRALTDLYLGLCHRYTAQ